MRKLLRWLGYGLLIILVLVLLFAAWVWIASAREIGRTHQPRPESIGQASPTQLADGRRLAQVLGCFSCHGEGLRGNKMFDAPGVATVWAPNLTEIAARATDQQLAQAIRQGLGIDGKALWIMPSPMYSRLTDEELAVVIAAIRAQPRGGEATPAVSIGPLGRFGVATGRFRSAPALMEEFRTRQPFDLGPEHARGRHIAATNCSECHGADLSGGRAGPDTPAPGLSIAGAYDLDQFRTLMRTGRAPHGRDLGLMAEVARNDFSHLTDAEIGRLHAYLAARAQRVQDPSPQP
jgi:cytochrome c553